MPPRPASTTTTSHPIFSGPSTPFSTYSVDTSATTPENQSEGNAESQPNRPRRSGRATTPTPAGRLMRQDFDRIKNLRLQREQAKALDAAGKGKGVQKGAGKVTKPAPKRQARANVTQESKDSDDSVDGDGDDELYVDDETIPVPPGVCKSSSAVPTSDPRELFEELTGRSGRDIVGKELHTALIKELDALSSGERKGKAYSHETLQEVIRLVRRDTPIPHESSQWGASNVSLSQEAQQNAGNGSHQGQGDPKALKRRTSLADSSSAKRARVELARTSSTVPELSPPPFEPLQQPALDPREEPRASEAFS